MEKLKELSRNVVEENKEYGEVTQHFLGIAIQADMNQIIVGEYLELDDNGACDFRAVATYDLKDLNDVVEELKAYDKHIEIWDETEWGEWSTEEENNTYIDVHLNRDLLNEKTTLVKI